VIKHKTFPVKASISEEYRRTLDFYTTRGHSLSRLFNLLLNECDSNKSFKFVILKQLEKYK